MICRSDKNIFATQADKKKEGVVLFTRVSQATVVSTEIHFLAGL